MGTYGTGGSDRASRLGDEFVRAKGGDGRARTLVEQLIEQGDPRALRWAHRWARQGCPEAEAKIAEIGRGTTQGARQARLEMIRWAEAGDEAARGRLVAWAADGDEDAWRSLHRTATKIAGSFTARFEGRRDPHRIADLAQDAMTALHQKFKKDFDHARASSYGALLYTMIGRMVMRSMRDQRREDKRLQVRAGQLRTRALQAWAVVDELCHEYAVTAEDLGMQLDRLPRREREVALLKARGWTVRETARELGLSLGSVHAALRNALAQLRSQIEGRIGGRAERSRPDDRAE